MFLMDALAVVDSELYMDVAVVLEIAHNATLVIDDVEDQSLLRRGQPTMHETEGLDVAVNTGVLMHLIPLQILLEVTSLTDEQKTAAVRVYTQELVAVYYGQALDIAWHQKKSEVVLREQYLEMCRLKTGGLMRMASRMACLIAKQDGEATEKVTRFAEAAGIAFQIRDDILDLTANEGVFGKAFGNDISEGKMSLPVILALSELNAVTANRLRDILNMNTRDKNHIREAHEIILSTSAIDEASEIAREMISGAWEDAGAIFNEESGKGSLEQLVNEFIQRDR